MNKNEEMNKINNNAENEVTVTADINEETDNISKACNNEENNNDNNENDNNIKNAEETNNIKNSNSKNKGTNNVKKTFNKVVKNRSFRYGTNSIILIAAVVAIAVVLNILVGLGQVKWDLTPNKLFSIGDTTKTILKELDQEVVIYGLFDDGKIGPSSEYKEVVELLDHYAKYPNITVKYVDPDKNPGILKQIDADGVLKDISKNAFVVKSGRRIKGLSYYDLFSADFNQQTFQYYKTGSTAEQGFTGAIKYVTAEFTPTIYFTTSHDEKDIEKNFSTLKAQMEYNNYDVKPINLITEANVPEDTEILVIASPKKDLTASEKDKIKEYLKNGGKAIFMFDYLELDPQFPQFENILMDYNLSLNYDKVKENDQNRHLPQNPYVVLMDVKSGAVISDNYNILLANSRSINILKNTKEYINVIPLARTSSKAVGEQVDKSKGNDIEGPLDVAVAVEHKGWQKISKIAVIGNSIFLEDSAQDAFGPYFSNGMAFFLETMIWMQDKKDETIIKPKNYQQQYLNITAEQAQYMGIIVVIVVPMLILLAGVFVYLRRRHL
ncbi:MAG TPA: GldG family protein [Clostridiales bacterium]|nr:GldG family protein [Clostridiales bacterium]